jgi:hypothetical protein
LLSPGEGTFGGDEQGRLSLGYRLDVGTFIQAVVDPFQAIGDDRVAKDQERAGNADTVLPERSLLRPLPIGGGQDGAAFFQELLQVEGRQPIQRSQVAQDDQNGLTRRLQSVVRGNSLESEILEYDPECFRALTVALGVRLSGQWRRAAGQDGHR